MQKFFLPIIMVGFCAYGVAQKNDDNASKNLPKLTADVIVSKHLASIGTPEALSAVKSRVLVGVGVHTSKIRPGRIGGPAQFASDGQKVLFAMILNSNDYPYDKVGYDCKDLTTAALPGGGSSIIGNFLKSNKIIIKRGLFGGVLSKGWPLLQPDKEVKFESGGTARVGEKNVYKLKFSASGIADMRISLYFDAETFRHVRSEYSYRTGQITSPNPNRPLIIGTTAPGTYTLTEDFSNFTKVDDLILPMTYVVEFTSDAGKPLVWTINFSQAFNNQPIDASAFRVS